MNGCLKEFSPGCTIGVLGGGQLGKMFAQVAQRYGYRIHLFAPPGDNPAASVAHRCFLEAYEDIDAIRAFAQSVSVVTLEFENISIEAVQEIERWCPVRPGERVLAVSQHRLVEKSFLAECGFPVTPHHEIRNEGDLDKAAERLG